MEKQHNDLVVLQANGLIHLVGKSENRMPESRFVGGTIPWFDDSKLLKTNRTGKSTRGYAGRSTASTINAISSILRHYGLSDSEISQSGLTNITGYASGTDYVNKSGIYRVNEKGMESVFSKQYGTLTFLNQGDKVFDANFTKSLLDNATIATQKNMPDYAGMAKAIEKNIQNIQNLSGNTYVNNFYIDGAQDTESILREIDKHLDKKIQAHDKKQVRDFRSLR